MNELEQTILDVVTGRQGCKYVELVTALSGRHPALANLHGYPLANVEEAVERMVADGTLIEVEYLLPSMPWRTKSFLLPGGTNVRVVAPEPIPLMADPAFLDVLSGTRDPRQT